MRQHTLADEFAPDMTEAKNADQPRALTHDEKKAAEAAFRNEPFNPAWSVAAANVYAGIQRAMDQQQASHHVDCESAEECIVGQ